MSYKSLLTKINKCKTKKSSSTASYLHNSLLLRERKPPVSLKQASQAKGKNHETIFLVLIRGNYGIVLSTANWWINRISNRVREIPQGRV